MSNAFWHCNCDLEPLLIASVKIARLEKEARLSLDAMEALREELERRDQEILALRRRLLPGKFHRDQTQPALLMRHE